jgi:hypothetical protein
MSRSPDLVKGTVTSTAIAGRPYVELPGETSTSIPCLSSYTPVVNDRVWVLIVGAVRLCLGD